MLVLSRKKNESIIINGDIRIEVLHIKGNQVRLGIVAPDSMKILRSELPAQPKSKFELNREPRVVSQDHSLLRETESQYSQIIDCELGSPMLAALQV